MNVKKLLALFFCLAFLFVPLAARAVDTPTTPLTVLPETTVGKFLDNVASSATVLRNGAALSSGDLLATGDVFETNVIVVLGDVDGDGKVTGKDYLRVRRSILQQGPELTGIAALAADVSGDGSVNALDYLQIKRHVLFTFKIGVGVGAKEVPILLYHHIVPDEYKNIEPWKNNDITITVSEFTRHMQMIKDAGYEVVTSDQVVDFVRGETVLPQKSVMLCFDDGYKSNTELAAPILRSFGYHATIFHIMAGLENPFLNYNPADLQYMAWQDINANFDVIDMQSHTHRNHNKLTEQSPEYIRYDLDRSQNVYKSKYFAYPYGDHDQSVMDTVRKAGFEAAFTTVEQAARPGDDLFAIPRFTVLSPMKDSDYMLYFPLAGK